MHATFVLVGTDVARRLHSQAPRLSKSAARGTDARIVNDLPGQDLMIVRGELNKILGMVKNYTQVRTGVKVLRLGTTTDDETTTSLEPVNR